MPIKKTIMLKKLSFLFLLTNLISFHNSFAQDSVPQGKTIDQIIAIIGKQVILQSDIETQALQLRAQGYYTSGDMKCEILEQPFSIVLK